MRLLTTIHLDKRYRREHSNKTFSSTRGQKSTRARAITDGKVIAISNRIERADEQRNARRKARA